jgi:phasin family protein
MFLSRYGEYLYLTLTYWRLIMLTAEQILASNKATLETLFGLTTKAFEGVEKMVELNVTAAKAALAESADHAKASLSVKDAQEFMALQAGMIQPLAEKTAAYSRHLYDIASGAGAEFTKNVEAQTTEAQKKILGLVDTAAKNAPAGSESAVAMMKSAVTAANNAFESVQKSVKQATEMAEKNFAAASETAVKATASATKKR